MGWAQKMAGNAQLFPFETCKGIVIRVLTKLIRSTYAMSCPWVASSEGDGIGFSWNGGEKTDDKQNNKLETISQEERKKQGAVLEGRCAGVGRCVAGRAGVLY